MSSQLIFGGVVWNIANCVEGTQDQNLLSQEPLCTVKITKDCRYALYTMSTMKRKRGTISFENVLKTRQLNRFAAARDGAFFFLKLCMNKIKSLQYNHQPSCF